MFLCVCGCTRQLRASNDHHQNEAHSIIFIVECFFLRIFINVLYICVNYKSMQKQPQPLAFAPEYNSLADAIYALLEATPIRVLTTNSDKTIHQWNSWRYNYRKGSLSQDKQIELLLMMGFKIKSEMVFTSPSK